MLMAKSRYTQPALAAEVRATRRRRRRRAYRRARPRTPPSL